MDAKQLMVLGVSVLASFFGDSAMGEESKVPYVRVAKIEIDAAQLEHYGLRSHRPRLMPKLSASSM